MISKLIQVGFELSCRCLYRTNKVKMFYKKKMLTSVFCISRTYSSSDDSDKKIPKNPYNTEHEESPWEKIGRILKDDVKRMAKGDFFSEVRVPVPRHTDIVVVGGGIMGSAIAYSLKSRAPDSYEVTVIDKDPSYARSSTALSVGGIRQQFSLEENIQLSLYSAEFMRNIKRNLCVLEHDPPDICFQPHGYLFLATEAGAEQMVKNHRLQKELGAKVELIPKDNLKETFPWLNTDGLVMGSYGVENEGWFDPWALLAAFKQKALFLGTTYVDAEVTGFDFEEIRVDPAMQLPEATYKASNVLTLKTKNGEIRKMEFAILIIATGADTGEFCKKLRMGVGPGLLSTVIPVEPRKRYVYVVHCPNGPGLDFPLVIDPTGTYVRREGLGGYYICGKSPAHSEEPDTSNLEVDYSFFDSTVWPNVAHRIPGFESVKLKSAWSGFYDYNYFDQNAILGYHPYYSNVFLATGFSGHGIQMAPGIGRAIAELILDGRYTTLDLDRFSLKRIYEGTPLLEKNIV